MNFEFDPAKSTSNKVKHGIDFVEAQMLWQDEQLLTVPLKFEKESRHGALGKIDEKLWFMAFTMREEKVRIISVRRAREAEKEYYENHQQNNQRKF